MKKKNFRILIGVLSVIMLALGCYIFYISITKAGPAEFSFFYTFIMFSGVLGVFIALFGFLNIVLLLFIKPPKEAKTD